MQFENLGVRMVNSVVHAFSIGAIRRKLYDEIVRSRIALPKRVRFFLSSVVCCTVLATTPLLASPKVHHPKAFHHAAHPKVPKHKAPKAHR
jgi:hypothetical protein